MADDASITSASFEHPTAQTARLRAKCERAVERLLALLDDLGPDPDAEPSLGFSEIASFSYGSSMDQRHIAEGTGDDREWACEDEGAQCEDEGDDSDTEQDYADHG